MKSAKAKHEYKYSLYEQADFCVLLVFAIS